MDPQRFDSLARSLASSRSRRHLARMMGAGLLSTVSFGERREGVSARICRIAGERCDDSNHCCNPAHVCVRGRCECGTGYTDCGGTCLDLTSDTANCGACGTACDEGIACCGGICCRNDYEVCCGGACIDLEFDDWNCGGCGQECPGGLRCCGSRCRDLSDDDRRCGGCSHDCATMGGTCEKEWCSCPPEYNCGSANRCGQPPDTPCCPGGECRGAYCCSASCDAVNGLCSPCEGGVCDDAADCCQDLPCVRIVVPGGHRIGRCGGCLDRAEYCDPDTSVCCAADCTFDRKEGRHVCLSRRDGPCQRDIDCAACYYGDEECKGICKGGQCTH
jgi:hypothetical protein